MTTEPYTPDEAEVIDCYAGAMEEQARENYDQAKADAERGIAKIKADALREAAEAWQAETGGVRPGPSNFMVRRAGRIEDEA